jgi:ATP-dependent 26S proteasome regulatory subunit
LKYLGAKEIIKDCILDTMQDEMIAALRKTQPLGILFFGAPGTGDFEKKLYLYNL